MPSAAVFTTSSRTSLLPAQPVRVDIPLSTPPTPSTTRVTAIIPCHNRPTDAQLLLGDLARINDPRIHLHILLIDNASDHPLSDLETPEGLDLEHVRLNTNTGGSGGFNAGLAHALTPGMSEARGGGRANPADASSLPDFLLLIDSDARLPAGTLTTLLAVLESDPTIVAAGPAIADPTTGRAFECGGHINCRTGAMEPMVSGVAGVTCSPPHPLTSSSASRAIACDYLAACCALVRTSAAIAAGPLPDTFLNADDAEWFIRMAQITGGRVVAVPGARAFHPRFDRFPTWTRYYSTRNAHGPIAAVGAPKRAHFTRAMKDAARAAALELTGRHDLARLHLKGLADAARNRCRGPAPNPAAAPTARSSTRPGTLARSALNQIPHHPIRALRAAGALTIGSLRAARISTRSHTGPSALNPTSLATHARTSGASRALSLEAIVLSYNRWPALEHTISSLLASPAFLHPTSDIPHPTSRTITIIDNHSTDGTPDRVEAFLLPGNESRLKLIRLDTNLGVEAFNRAVQQSTADIVLILDDDATPDPDSLDAALELLVRNPTIAAIPLHPIHPKSGASEWSFATRHLALSTQHSFRFPLMGSANLIRRSAWLAVGGYESAFFLYRNDADLALKLLDSHRGVHFNPALFAHHDTPAGPGVPKSTRWHELATRNWIWMAKRHSGAALPGGVRRVLGIALGWLWAHKLAGLSPSRHVATLRGALKGLRQPAPHCAPSDGQAWHTLLRLHLSRV